MSLRVHLFETVFALEGKVDFQGKEYTVPPKTKTIEVEHICFGTDSVDNYLANYIIDDEEIDSTIPFVVDNTRLFQLKNISNTILNAKEDTVKLIELYFQDYTTEKLSEKDIPDVLFQIKRVSDVLNSISNIETGEFSLKIY